MAYLISERSVVQSLDSPMLRENECGPGQECAHADYSGDPGPAREAVSRRDECEAKRDDGDADQGVAGPVARIFDGFARVLPGRVRKIARFMSSLPGVESVLRAGMDRCGP